MPDDFAATALDPAVYEREQQERQNRLELVSGLCRGQTELIAQKMAEYDAMRKEIRERHGFVAPPPKTEEQLAKDGLAAHWSGPRPLSEGFSASIATELDRTDGLTDYERERDITALRREVGSENYDRMIAEAKVAPGVVWRKGIECSGPVLRLLASRGRYFVAYSRARAASGLK